MRDLTGAPNVLNIDATIVASHPMIGPYREAMRRSVARILGIEVNQVSIKASSGNGLTDFGKGEGVAATVVVLVEGS